MLSKSFISGLDTDTSKNRFNNQGGWSFCLNGQVQSSGKGNIGILQSEDGNQVIFEL